MFDAIDRLQREIDNLHSFGGADYSSGVWTPTFTGFSADPANPICRYVLVGKMCTCFVTMPNSGTSSTTGFTMTAPFTATTVATAVWGNLFWTGVDNGSVLTTPGSVRIISAGTSFILRKTIDGADASWTNANGKCASFAITYEIA
jgi:hypothetical protein